MVARDNFLKDTVRELAGRAGHACSNPDCRLPTSGAAFGDEGKVVIVGVAAHIKAAAPGGPRYDPVQTPEERRHASNGIWLCTAHAKQIDDDAKHFTVEKLKGWKKEAERRSALAILTLQVPNANATLQSGDEQAANDLAHRLGLSPQDNLLTVTARLRQAATRDLAAFVGALKSPVNAISLDLRLIESQQVTSFQVEGLAAAICTFNEIVVVAAPGTGKTTTLLQVAHNIATNERLVATFIPLSEWSAQSHTLLQSVVQRAAFAGEREEHLKLLAHAGRLVLVMDGWNELDATSRKRLRAEIQSMQRDYPSLGIVMSTRVRALDVPISGPVVEIEQLSETQQLLIVRAYRGDAGERILDQAWRTRGLRDLVAIPLFLTTLLSDTPGENLPTTKEEVLRLFVAEIDRNANKGEALDAVASGFHSAMLTAIAADATLADNVTVSNHRARSVISNVTGRLVSEGQISTAPQPDAVLTALVSYHVLVRTATGVAFQHQQFQEWFASQDVETLMMAAAAGDEVAHQQLRNSIINAHAWEEPVLFACERASRGGTDSVLAAANVVLDALAIDPMLAAEAIYRSSEALWSIVKDRVVTFAYQWHAPKKIDRAVRFMIKTGRCEFAEIIWSFIADPNDQVYLEALRAGGRFRLPVLGTDAAERITWLPPEHRSHVLSELVMYGGIEGIDVATGIALSDDNAEVKVAVAEALHFRQANRQMQRLLIDAPSEVWQTLALKGYGEDPLEPEIAERLHQEAGRLIQEEQDPARRLHALLRSMDNRRDVGAQVQSLIETADFSENESRGGDAIYEASRLYPDEVRNALVGRLERRLPFPLHAEMLLKDTDAVIDDGAIADLALAPGIDQQLANGAAGLLGHNTTGKLIDALLAMREQLNLSPPPVTSDEYHHVCGLVALTPAESFATAVLSRASTSDPKTIEALADLFARHGDTGDRGRIGLGEASRQAMIAVVRKWAETLLADERTTRHALGTVARAIERLAAPELAELLARMLARDLAQWRMQRQEQAEARIHGRHDGSSEAYHSWTLQYGRAFSAIGGDQAVTTMQAYLLDTGHSGFGLEAAQVLHAIWNQQQGITNDGPFRGAPEFSEVRVRRDERQSQEYLAASPFAEEIFRAVDQLLLRGGDNEAQSHALQLAAIGVSMPYGDKRTTIDRLLHLPQPYSTKLGLFTALVKAGKLIDATLVVDAIHALLEDAKTKPWLLQENQGTIDRWLVLLPFTDRPGATLEVLDLLDSRIRLPWRLRPVLSALGFAPSDTAEKVLLGLAEKDLRFLDDYDWFAALEKRGTLSSLRILLDLVCQDAVNGRHGSPDKWTFGRRLAAGMQSHPEFRADVYARLAGRISPQARALAEYAVAVAPDESGVLLLVSSHASDGREFDSLLGSAIEHLVVEQRPSSDWVGAYESISRPATSLRRRLFEIARTPAGHEARLATACLVHIDELRDRHGIASGEPRHPDIGSCLPWPLIVH